MIVLLPIDAGAAVLGALLLWLGVRGGRVNDHPVCRGCGFDLAGVYPGAAVCPECGRALGEVGEPRRERGAVRIGVRRPRPGMIACGGALGLIGLLGAGAVVTVSMLGSSWDAKKPLRLLLFESRYGSAERISAVGDELHRRMTAGELTDPEQVRRVVDAALRVQADLAVPWNTKWGDVVESATLQGAVSPHAVDSYIRQQAVFEIRVRPVVRQGDPLRVHIATKELRAGWRESVRGLPSDPTVTIDGRPLVRRVQLLTRLEEEQQQYSLVPDLALGQQRWAQSYELPPDLAPGLHRVEVQCGVNVMPPLASGRPAADTVRQTVVGSQAVRVLAPPADSIERVSDPLAIATLGSMLSSTEVTVWRLPWRVSAADPPETDNAIVQFELIGAPPVGGAFDVTLRSGDREWPVGRLFVGSAEDGARVLPIGQGDTHFKCSAAGPVVGLDADIVDVVLVPNLDAARESIDLMRVCDQPIIINDVRVTRRHVTVSG